MKIPTSQSGIYHDENGKMDEEKVSIFWKQPKYFSHEHSYGKHMDLALYEAIKNDNYLLLIHSILDHISIRDQILMNDDLHLALKYDAGFILEFTDEKGSDAVISGDLFYKEFEELAMGVLYENHEELDDAFDTLEEELSEFYDHADYCRICMNSYLKILQTIEQESDDLLHDCAESISSKAEEMLYHLCSALSVKEVRILMDHASKFATVELETDFFEFGKLEDLEIVADQRRAAVEEMLGKLPRSLIFGTIDATNGEVSNKWKLISKPIWFLINYTSCRIDKMELYLASILVELVNQQDLLRYIASDVIYNKSTISKYISELARIVNDFQLVQE